MGTQNNVVFYYFLQVCQCEDWRVQGIKKPDFLRSDLGLEGRLQTCQGLLSLCESNAYLLTYLKNFIACNISLWNNKLL